MQNDFRFTVSERAAANVDTIKRSSNNVIDFMESEGYFRFKADYSISSNGANTWATLLSEIILKKPILPVLLA